MGKRDKKRKKKQQQGPADEYGDIGLLSSMRGGFKNVVGSGKGKGGGDAKTPVHRIRDVIYWVVIAGLLALLLYRFGAGR